MRLIIPNIVLKRIFVFLLFLLNGNLFCFGQTPSTADLLNMVDKGFNEGARQYALFQKRLAPDRFPRSYNANSDSLLVSNSGWWCSGFYPGTLLYLYEQTKNSQLLTEAERILKLLSKEQYNKDTHDLGFMMYCSFGNANRIQASEEYKQILINSAKSLSSRFDSVVGCIRSWNSKQPNDYLVIIDNMMNLELLFWATKATGDSSYYKIAVTHANTTIKNHFRPDYSSYHVVNYDAGTGAIHQKKTAQGYADESAWARGQAWGLYGFTAMYRETRNKKYLDQATHIADFILKHPNLPKDKIPYWDFNAPDIPNTFRDASAAAIIASALLELEKYVSKVNSQKYLSVAEQILQNLSTQAYTAAMGTNGGFILKHSVGSLPGNSEVDMPLTYADYYYIEALGRLKKILTN